MSLEKLNPYIHLNGDAAKAIATYESALGAKVQGPVMRYGDVPGMNVAEEHKSRVMHAELHIGPGVIMISDSQPDKPVTVGGNVEIALNYTDLNAMSKAFDALAAGGKIGMPIADTFWGAKFGALTDAYGIKWMFNCQIKKP